MGVSLSYSTSAPVSPEVRKAVLADARRLNKQRLWWAENILFFTDPNRRSYLTGDTKLFRSDGSVDDDQFMAFHDGRFILLTLSDWSRKHGLTWILEMHGEELGRISDGKITPPELFGADATAEELSADAERARQILAEYADDVESSKTTKPSFRMDKAPGHSGENPKQMRTRWNKNHIAQARKALSAAPDLDALRNIFGDITIDGQSYIDCRGLSVAKEAILELQAAYIDFSYSQFEYPLARVHLENCRFVGVKYAEKPFSGEYIGCDFTCANLRRTTMTAKFRMEACNFTQTNCTGSEWTLANFDECLFVETNIKGIEWTLCKFKKCIFTNMNIADAYISGCSFIDPIQNMKWFDENKNDEFTHMVREDATWVDWHGAHTSDMRIK